MPLIPSDLQPIVLGNPTAKHTITMVTNPYCGPCAKAHIELEEVLSENPHLKAQIIFAVCYDSDGRKSKVARHLLNLTPTPLLLRGAMEAWYAQTTKDYDTWAAQYPADVSAVPDNAIAAHCEWTKTAHIEGTPTLFVDGYEVPQVYGLKQSANLLPHLNEELTH
ncbi:MAG: thioredoxin domain-containing protein [Spirosomataceae bacterium]